MREEWKKIPDYPGYEVSNTGKIRSYWKKQKRKGTWGGTDRILMDSPVRELPQSDDGNGYMKVYLQNAIKRTCVKVHRLVAEAFLPLPDGIDDPTVDHIMSGPTGKKNNQITNLRWMSRADNIRKAYKDGMCDERIHKSRREVIAYDKWFNEEIYFESIRDVGEYFEVDYTTISHLISNGKVFRNRYEFYYLINSTQKPEDILITREIGRTNRYGYDDRD